jgi:hypothetical protein
VFPAVRWTAQPGGSVFCGYSTYFLVDTTAGIIVDVEATSAHCGQEAASTKSMLGRLPGTFRAADAEAD